MPVLVPVKGLEGQRRLRAVEQRPHQCLETLQRELWLDVHGRHLKQLGWAVAHLLACSAVAVDEAQRIGTEHKHAVERLVERGLEVSERRFALPPFRLRLLAHGDVGKGHHRAFQHTGLVYWTRRNLGREGCPISPP